MKALARKIKRCICSLLGKDLYLIRTDINVARERFGSHTGGGWDIAIKPINKNSIVYSFGVGKNVSFDITLIERFGLTVHAFDPTPKSIEWVKRQHFPVNFIMHEYGIMDFDGNMSFNPPENPNYISYSIIDKPATKGRSISLPVKRLSTIMKELGHSRIDILKMDVEGAEYCIIEDMDKSHIYPEQILVEFHHKFPNVGVGKTKEAIRKLRRMGYALFYISATRRDFCFIYKPN